MSVHKDLKRKTWYFVVRIGDKQYKRRDKSWTTKKQALAAEREFLMQMDTLNTSDSELTFEEVCERYIAYTKTVRKESSVKTINTTLKKHALDYLGNMKILNINTLDIEEYQAHLLSKTYGDNQKYTNNYLSKVQTYTRLVFDYAVRHRIIPYNPFDPLEPAKHQAADKKKEITVLTNKQYEQFMIVIEDQEDRALFSVLYWCGLRIGEVLGLSMEDYDRDTKMLTVKHTYNAHTQKLTTTKTGNERIIGVPDKCVEELELLFNEYKEKGIEIKNDFALFGAELRLSKTQLDRRKNKYIESSKIPYVTFHEFRHTHVSTLIQLGLRPIDIANRLGHSVEQVNNTYGHLFEDDKTNIMNTLNSI